MPDREKVIKGWECHMEADTLGCADCPYRQGWRTCNFADTLFKDVYALLKEHGWIPITERLPKDDTDILVYCTDGEESRIVAVNYANGVWFDCVFNTVMVVENITHWMPLPEPPKEGR